MNDWSEGIQNAIRYIEDNLTETLDIRDIAAQAYVSAFHFQRIFGVLCVLRGNVSRIPSAGAVFPAFSLCPGSGCG